MDAPHPKPTAAPVHPDRIPAALRAADRWLGWRYEPKPSTPNPKSDDDYTKVPYRSNRPNDRAASTNPATWSPFARALAAFRDPANAFDGIGFTLAEVEPAADVRVLVALDLDDCRDPETGEIAPDALALVEAFRGVAYAEVTPSRTGLRVLAYGPRCEHGKKFPNTHGCKALEIFTFGRYLAVTGDALAGFEDLDPTADATDQLLALYGELAPASPATRTKSAPKTTSTPATRPATTTADAREIDSVRRRAKGSAKIRRLWYGDWSHEIDPATGAPDHSRADLALCRALRFFGATSPATIDALFRESKLYRADKWDRPARTGETYGEGTVRRAFDAVEPLEDRPFGTVTTDLYADDPGDFDALDLDDDEIDDAVARLRAENQQLRHTLRRIQGVLAVPSETWSATHKVATIALYFATEAKTRTAVRDHASATGVDPAAVSPEVVERIATEPKLLYRAEVARAIGTSEDRAGKLIREIAATGVVTVESKTTAAKPETGEISGRPETRLYIAPPTDPTTGEVSNILDAAARFSRPAGEERQHGGRRVKGSGCTRHPEADALCVECAREVDPESLAKIEERLAVRATLAAPPTLDDHRRLRAAADLRRRSQVDGGGVADGEIDDARETDPPSQLDAPVNTERESAHEDPPSQVDGGGVDLFARFRPEPPPPADRQQLALFGGVA